MSRSTTKRAELELALATLCDPDARTGYDALIQRIEKLEGALRKGAFAQPIQQDVPKPTAAEPVQTVETAEPIAAKPEKAAEPEIKPKAVEAAPPKPAEPPKKSAAPAVETVLPFAKWEKVLDALARINPANYNMLRDTRAFFNGKQVLIDVSNPVILNMLRSNEYLKTNIKQAILEATGERYGLGPYRPEEEQKQQQDPLELFIKTLPQSPEIVIE